MIGMATSSRSWDSTRQDAFASRHPFLMRSTARVSRPGAPESSTALREPAAALVRRPCPGRRWRRQHHRGGPRPGRATLLTVRAARAAAPAGAWRAEGRPQAPLGVGDDLVGDDDHVVHPPLGRRRGPRRAGAPRASAARPPFPPPPGAPPPGRPSSCGSRPSRPRSRPPRPGTTRPRRRSARRRPRRRRPGRPSPARPARGPGCRHRGSSRAGRRRGDPGPRWRQPAPLLSASASS